MRYIDPRDHGCDACGRLFGWEAVDVRELPDLLVPADRVLAGHAGSWTKNFHRCRSCRSWWCVFFNPKDMIYDKTAVDASVQRALRADAPLEAAWPFLFAHAPIDAAFENYLYAGHFDPQKALDRLLSAFSAPRATPANQDDILRMLSRLLALRNPDHRRLQQERGWVWEPPPAGAFREPLLAFEHLFYSVDGRYSWCRRYGEENMKSLRWILERDANGKCRIFRAPPAGLDPP